jgi:predicted RNA-binding protein YlxR (DUF448 family)
MTAALATDTPDVARAAGPQRRCLVTGEERPKAELVRFVVGPDGAIVPDVDGRLPGRGLWTVARREAVAEAVRRRVFARGAKRPVQVAPDLADQVEALLARRCVEGLGLARRAGQAVCGFERVRDWIGRGKCGALVTAAEPSADGRGKLAGSGVPVAAVLRAEELAAAFGREATAYVGVARGALAERILIDAARLSGFRAPERR